MNRKKKILALVLLAFLKKAVVLVILLLFCGSSKAQHTLEYTAQNTDYRQGLELIDQQNYVAAEQFFRMYINANPHGEQVDEANYYILYLNYMQRKPGTTEAIVSYLIEHPYSQHIAQLHFMAGILYVEAKKSKLALEEFRRADNEHLTQTEKNDLQFYTGIANLQQKQYQTASDNFEALLGRPTAYKLSSQYYYAYCQYIMGNYKEAKPHFIQIEHIGDYRQTVPYYLCQIYFSEGNYEAVEERAEYLLKEYPKNKENNELHRMLGEIAYIKGRYAEAEQHIEEYKASTKKTNRSDMYLLGMAQYRLGKYGDAVKNLQKVTNKADSLAENAYLHIGHSYVQQKNYDQARMAYAQAQNTNFDARTHQEAMYNYAMTTYQTTDAFGESITALGNYIAAYPDADNTPQAQSMLMEVLLKTRNYQTALNEINKIKKPTEKVIDTKYYLTYKIGTEAFAGNNLAKALDCFNTVIEAGSNNYQTECYLWRGETYYRNKQYKLSAQDFETYINRSKGRTDDRVKQAYYGAGYSHFSLKQYDTAQKQFNQFIAISDKSDTRYTDVLNRIADTYFSKRSLTTAESNYSKAFAAGGKGKDYALFQRGYCLGLLKQYEKKIAVMDQLVRQMPRSSYADDALYESGRAYIQLNRDPQAVETYRILLDNYPNSDLAPKAALEIAMIYDNQNNHEQSIKSYKQVIKDYPGSEESYTALDALEETYITLDRVKEYIDYTKTLGRVIKTNAATKEDSLTYMAAERQYVQGKYQQAAQGMKNYVVSYCPDGRYCTVAQYYMADSYYRIGQKDEALNAYAPLTEMKGSTHREEACLRAAEISYDKKDYANALIYFTRLQECASIIDNAGAARLGILRCNYYLKDIDNTIRIATQIVDDSHSENEVAYEARYHRAQAYMTRNDFFRAQPDLREVAKNTQSPYGAQAKYQLAEILYNQKDLDKAEEEIMDFARKGTPHQYWLAKAMVLLADIYILRDDDFQAKQYLLSLQANYTVNDDIQPQIKQRLDAIAQREEEKVE